MITQINQTPQTCVYKTVGECQIKANVFCPVDVTGATPAVVFLHGGALISGSRRMLKPYQANAYLDAGYAVIAIDYRLAPESKIPAIIEDLQDAFQWVAGPCAQRFGIDPRRIAAVGHSAGGYLALMAGCCVTPRPKAIVAFYGYGDVIGDWYSKPDPFYCEKPAVTEEESGRHLQGPVLSEPYEGRGKEKFYLYCRQNGLWPLEVGGRDPHTEPEFFTPYCSERNVGPDYPPTLLLHGDLDTDVPHYLSVNMAKELARHQVEHELITMKGLGHSFDKQEDNPDVQAAFVRVLDFLAQHLG